MFKAITKRLQAKLTIAFVLVMLIPVVVIVAFNVITFRDSLINNLTQQEITEVQTQADAIGQQLEAIQGDTLFLSENPDIGIYINSLAANPDFESLARIHEIFTSFILSNPLAVKDVRILDRTGQEVVRVDNNNGTPIVISRTALENTANRPYFIAASTLPQGELYASGFELNITGLEVDTPFLPVIHYSTPLYNNIDSFAGVLVVKILAAPLIEPLYIGEAANTYIVDTDGTYLAHPSLASLYGGLIGTDNRFTTDRPSDAAIMNLNDNGFILESPDLPGTFQSYVRIQPAGQENIDWLVIHAQPSENIYDAILAPLSFQILISLGAIVIAIASAFVIAQNIVRPLRQLATAAKAIGAGQKNVTVLDIKSDDEIGELSQAFNTMSLELGEIYNSLEDRITARTADLEASAEIAGAANQVREVGDLLSLAANLIRDRFNFYYVQVYIVQGAHAVLREGTGYVGRRLLNKGHSLPIDGRSLVATTISTGKAQVVQDTQGNPNFLPNELLPETRAELTIPLRTKTAIIGVLDIQHSIPNVFDEASQRLFQTMADQIAVTFENVNLFESTQRRAVQLQTVAQVSAAATSNLNMDELLKQVANLTKDRFNLYHAHIYLYDHALESLVLAAGAGETGRLMKEHGHAIPYDREQSLVARAARTRQGVIVNDVTQETGFLANPLLPDTKSELAVPMIIGDELIGVLDVQSDQLFRFDNEDLNVQNSLAGQVAVAVNNARSFERVRAAQEEVSRIFNQSVDLIGTAGFDGTFIDVNPAWEQILGYSRAELVGQPFISFVHPDHVDATNAEAARIGEGAKALSFENRYRHKDGSWRWLSWNATPDVERGVIYFVTRDVTQSKLNEEERTTLGEISNKLVAAGNREQLLEAINVYGKVIDADTTTLIYIDSNEHGEAEWTTVVAEWRKDGTPSRFINVPLNLKNFPIAKFWMSDPENPLFIEDIATDSRIDDNTRATYTQIGVHGVVILPLNLQGRWVGLASYSWHHPTKFDELERSIFIGIMQRATLAIDAARAFERVQTEIMERQKNEEERSVLADVSNKLVAARTHAELIDAVSMHGGTINAFSTSLVYLDTDANNQPEWANVIATSNQAEGSTVARTEPLYMPSFGVAKLWMSDPNNPVMIGDLDNDERIDEATRVVYTGSSASVILPLHLQDRWIGLIIYSWLEPVKFTELHERIFIGVMQRATLAVDAARATESINEARDEANELYGISKEINAAKNEQDLVDIIVRTLKHPSATSVALTLWENYDFDIAQSFTTVASWSPDNAPVIRTTVPVAGFPFLPYLDRHNVAVSNDIANDERIDPISREMFLSYNIGAYMFAPLTIGERWIGNMGIYSPTQHPHTIKQIRLMRGATESLSAAVERLANLQQAERRASELATVAEVSAAATSTLDVVELLTQVTNLAKERFNLYHAHVYLLDDSGKSLVLTAGAGSAGMVMREAGHAIPISREQSLVARAGRNREGVIINDITQEPGFLPNPLLPDTKSELAVPLIVGNTLIGVLDVQSDIVNRFTFEDVRIQATLADQIAVAVQNARAFQQVQLNEAQIALRAEEMETIAEISALVGGNLLVDELLQQVTDLAKEKFKRYHAQIYLLDAAGENLVLAAGADEAGRTMKQRGHSIALNREQSLVARAARSHQAVIIDDVTKDDGFLANPLLPDTKSEMALPMIFGTQVIGVLDIQDDKPHAFTEVQANAKIILAGQIAASVQNARAFEQVINAQENITEQRVFLQRVLNNIPSAVFVKNYNGEFILANESLGAMYLTNADDFIGKTDADFNPNTEEVAAFLEADRVVMDSGEPLFILEEPVTNPQGITSWYQTSKVPLVSADGSKQVLGVITDITERKIAEEEREVLSEVSDRLVAATDYDGLINAFSFYAERMGASDATIMYIDNDAQGQPEVARIVAAWRNDGAANPLMGMPISLANFPFAKLWMSNPESPILIEDLQTDPRLDPATREIYLQTGAIGTAILPLQLQGRWVGLAAYNWGQATTFTATQHRIFLGMMERATLAIDAARATEAIAVAREESGLLYDISKEINAATNEQELVDVVVRHLGFPEASVASLTLWDNLDFDTTQNVNVVARWSRDGSVQRPMVIPKSRFPFISLLDRHSVGIFDDVSTDERMDDIGRETFMGLGYKALIFAPLTVGDRWIGSIGIYSDQPHHHDDRLVRMLRGVTEQLTAAVERLNILRQVERHAAELETVARVSAATTTLLDVNELLYAVAELTKDSFKLYHAHIYLLDSDGDNLVLTAGAGEAGRLMRELGHSIPFKHPNSIVARAARTREGVVSNDITQAENFLPNPLLPDTKSELALPMVIGNELIGVLDVQSEFVNRFSDQDIAVQSTLADQIAVAVNNARVYEVEREAAEHLREVDRLKSQFLANMSHELRTPLNSIIGYSEVLLDGVDGELPDEANEDVEAIHDSGKHLLALINEILDMAKIDAGQLHLDRRPAEVAKVVSEVLKVGQSLIKDKPLAIEVVEDMPVPMVFADALRVRQILLNLVGNAVKFTENGTVTISYGMHNEREIYLRVHDTGVGINEDNLRVVFERFRQVDGSSTRRAGGTGLGLSITQQLVQLHGGDIFAESEPGVGSTFWFTLPILTEQSAPAPTAEVATTTTNGKH